MKYAFALFSLCLGLSGFSQPSKLVTAHNYLIDKQFDKAKESIDKASEHSSTSENAKTWKFKGDIYVGYYKERFGGLNSQDKLEEVLSYYKKAIDLDSKHMYEEDIRKQWTVSQNLYLNQGVEFFNQKKFSESYSVFVMTNTIADFLGTTDTLAMYNSGLAAERLGMDVEAIRWYDKCEALGYNGASCCSFSVYLHRKLGNYEMMTKRLEECRIKYPTDQNLLITDINNGLKEGELERVLNMLDKAIEAEPKNYVLYFTQGTVYDGLNNTDKAEEKYFKALELNPNYFDASYNLGALYFNLAADANNEMVEEKNPDKYLEMKSKTEELIVKALPHLEKASALKPDNLITLKSLQQIYLKLDEDEKYEKVTARITSLSRD